MTLLSPETLELARRVVDETWPCSMCGGVLHPVGMAHSDAVRASQSVSVDVLTLARSLLAVAPIVEAAEGLSNFHPPGDWACAECRPESDALHAGFRCSHHVLFAALAAARSAKT